MTPPSTDTSTPLAAQAHARSMAGTVIETMPTLPADASTEIPDGVDPSSMLWSEVVAGGGYTSLSLPRGARLRLVDRTGDACAGLLLHRADRPIERLNVADTVKVQWQAYLGESHLLFSDMGRVMASILHADAVPVDAFTGTSNHDLCADRYGDGAPDGPTPNGRDLFTMALAKRGLDGRDVAPNVNLFKGVSVAADGTLSLDHGGGREALLRMEMDVIVSIVNVPHPLDQRTPYPVTPLLVQAWAGPVTPVDDPVRTATPEGERAFLNTEAEWAMTSPQGGTPS